jgi:hypothetical protein
VFQTKHLFMIIHEAFEYTEDENITHRLCKFFILMYMTFPQ